MSCEAPTLPLLRAGRYATAMLVRKKLAAGDSASAPAAHEKRISLTRQVQHLLICSSPPGLVCIWIVRQRSVGRASELGTFELAP